MSLPDDWLGNGLPVYHGEKDRSLARKAIDRLNGPDGFKTAYVSHADGSVTRVQLKGDMPPQVIRIVAPSVPQEPERGFCVIVKRIKDNVVTADAATFIHFTDGRWKKGGKPPVTSRVKYSVAAVKPRTIFGIAWAAASAAIKFYEVFSPFSGALYRIVSKWKTFITTGNPVVVVEEDVDGYADYDHYAIFGASVSGVTRHDTTTGEELESAESSVYRDTLPDVTANIASTYAVSADNRTFDAFGMEASYEGSAISNKYYWWMRCILATTEPFITTTGGTAWHSNAVYLDVSAAGSGGSTPWDVTEMPPNVPSRVPVFDVFWFSTTYVSSYEDSYGYTRDLGTPIGTYHTTFYSDVHPSGTGDRYYWASAPSFSDTKQIAGGRTLTRSISAMVDWRSESGLCTPRANWDYEKLYGLCHVRLKPVATEPSVYGGGGFPAIGSSGLLWGNVSVYRYRNSATTTVTYSVTDLPEPLFSFAATVSFDYKKSDGVVYGDYQNIGQGRAWYENLLTDDTVRAAVSGYLASGYYYKYVEPSAYLSYADVTRPTINADAHSGSAATTVSASCVDYLYYDQDNRVSIALKTTFEGKVSEPYGSDLTSTGRATLTLRVAVFGNTYSIELASATGSCAVRATTYYYQANNDHNPRYVAGATNDGVFAPICNQADFKYIAYTTALEAAAGVSPRFILSAPLFISRQRPSTWQGTYPEPPHEAYTWRPLNASSLLGMTDADPFADLETKVVHLHVDQKGFRCWLTDFTTDTDSEAQFAECYRL